MGISETLRCDVISLKVSGIPGDYQKSNFRFQNAKGNVSWILVTIHVAINEFHWQQFNITPSRCMQNAEQHKGLLLEDAGHVDAQWIHGEALGLTAAKSLASTGGHKLHIHYQLNAPH